MSSDQWSDLVCLVRARLIRVLHVVPSNEFGAMVKFGGKKPQSFFVSTGISSPADKVEELAVTPSPINLGVKDFLDFVFNFSINLNQRWQRLSYVRNSAWMGEFELGDMEDGMYRLHRVGECYNQFPPVVTGVTRELCGSLWTESKA